MDMDMDMDIQNVTERPDQEAKEDIFEEVSNVEQNFYQQGYTEGYSHGRLHGLFEGRQLGREKGWEIVEEIGFYSGWAEVHRGLLERRGVKAGGRGKESRALNHSNILLDLISKFPMTNPSDTAPSTMTLQSTDPSLHPSNVDTQTQPISNETDPQREEIDFGALISNIRARYRLLCSSLNVKPRLAVAQMPEGGGEDGTGDAGGEVMGVITGIEGPMKGVNTKQLLY